MAFRAAAERSKASWALSIWKVGTPTGTYTGTKGFMAFLLQILC